MRRLFVGGHIAPAAAIIQGFELGILSFDEFGQLIDPHRQLIHFGILLFDVALHVSDLSL